MYIIYPCFIIELLLILFQILFSVNNQNRTQCAQQFISLNGTQAVIRMVLCTHGKRDGNVSSELMLQDLIWLLAALAPKGT